MHQDVKHLPRSRIDATCTQITGELRDLFPKDRVGGSSLSPPTAALRLGPNQDRSPPHLIVTRLLRPPRMPVKDLDQPKAVGTTRHLPASQRCSTPPLWMVEEPTDTRPFVNLANDRCVVCSHPNPELADPITSISPIGDQEAPLAIDEPGKPVTKGAEIK